MRGLLLVALLASSPAIAGSNFDKALAAEAAWKQCAIDAARSMAGRAAAETIAEAALSRCQRNEDTFRARLADWSRPLGIGAPLPPEELDRQLDKVRRQVRGAAIAAALE